MVNNTIAFVSSYPRRDVVHDVKTVGGAAYSKDLLYHLKKAEPGLQIHVFAERFEKESKDTYRDSGMSISRLWRRNDPISLLQLLMKLLRSKSQVVMISYEINMFGGTLAQLVFLSTLPVLKIFGKKIVCILHHVVTDIEIFEENPMKRSVMYGLSKAFYWYLKRICDKIVVFERFFKKQLNHPNVVEIPLAFKAFSFPTQKTALTQLGLNARDTHVLYFGYISPYKGILDLLNKWPKNSDSMKMIVAGGANPNHLQNKKYMKYVSKTVNEAQKKQISVTGVLKEAEIPMYFSASDIVILPYKTFFSSSGPLSIAFLAEKPVLLSEALIKYFDSNDFKAALKCAGLTTKDMTFSLEQDDIYEKIKKVLELRDRFTIFSRTMKGKRTWKNSAEQYLNLIRNL